MSHKNIAILGGGSWGIAVANLLQMNTARVSIWEFNREDFLSLKQNREHRVKLPGITIPDDIKLYNDLEPAATDKDIICLAVPSHTVAQVCKLLNKRTLKPDVIIVNLAKGIETDSLQRMSEVINREIEAVAESQIVTISGPSHAEEVARNLPTSVVAGCTNEKTAEIVRDIFSNDFFRTYSSADIIGVETGGAFKNVIAIASGIVDGLGGGDNARGALFTRGIAEISRLGVAMGAEPLTFAGLSGLGDLVTTCISRHSRNRTFGEKIGRGQTFDEALTEMTMVVEGVNATQAAFKLMTKFNIEMPITKQVNSILFRAKNPQDALIDLMTRDLKSEF